MTALLSLLLLAQAESNTATRPFYPTFQAMLDSAQIVVIAKVDSMYYTGGEHSMPRTHYLAELIALCAKTDSLPLPKGSIHIVVDGGIGSDGRGYFCFASTSFKLGEVFLSPVKEYYISFSENQPTFTSLCME
ncbi:hypothetical protein JXM67_03855 [candidate division WOR-3 bacterium]|nr:hypothetical protein [candidate division WOR-3 bacterium]